LEAINFFLRPRVVQSVYGIYVILMLATMPLAYGWIVYNLKLMRGKDPVLADLFTGYRHFIDIIALSIRGFCFQHGDWASRSLDLP
jgi:hypothetical protein